MEDKRITVLLIEDSPEDAAVVSSSLLDHVDSDGTGASFELMRADTLNAGLAVLIHKKIDAILVDLSLPDSPGLNSISSVRSLAPATPIIALTRREEEHLAVEGMQQGIQDYLVKSSLNGSGLGRIIRNAIERQRLVAELAAKAFELEARNKELDEFAQTVAHQVQGLLSQMVGYTGFIEMQYAGELDQEAHRILKRILQSGNKMNNVISELLLLASVRKDEVTRVPLHMGRIVGEAKKRLRFQMESFEGQLIQPESWPVAMGYPSWVEEVWVNYISNALKYGGESGEISLGAEIQENGMVCFWVEDEGMGIDPLDQKKLFKPHTRLRQIRARGDGLGLSIVRRIVEKCGGEVGVTSELGQGSKFWFTLSEANVLPQDVID